jgi:hypothetical protein
MNVALLVKWIWRLFKDAPEVLFGIVLLGLSIREAFLPQIRREVPHSGAACTRLNTTSNWGLGFQLETAPKLDSRRTSGLEIHR